MITIKEFFKYENANAIEVTWIETKQENFIKKEIVDDEEVETVETIIHCQSFADSQIDLLRQTAKHYDTPLTQEQEDIIKDVLANRILPTKEELEAIASENEKQRVIQIKQEAGRIIKSKYSIEWQLNHPRLDVTYINEYEWIDNIRAISNQAELGGTSLENIDWGI